MTTETGYIPTHDGTSSDPYIRNADQYGPIDAYMPWFPDIGQAKSWCRAVDAVPCECSRNEAAKIAADHGARFYD